MQQLDKGLIDTFLRYRKDQYLTMLDIETSTKSIQECIMANDLDSVEKELMIRQNEIDSLKGLDENIIALTSNLSQEIIDRLYSFEEWSPDSKELVYMNGIIKNLGNRIGVLDRSISLRLGSNLSIYSDNYKPLIEK